MSESSKTTKDPQSVGHIELRVKRKRGESPLDAFVVEDGCDRLRKKRSLMDSVGRLSVGAA